MSFKKVKATKTNLIKLEKRKNLAVKGERYLEFKREQLSTEINTRLLSYLSTKSELMTLYKRVIVLLHQTYKEMGKRDLLLISDMSKLQYSPKVEIQYKKDLNIPSPEIKFTFDIENKLPAYNFDNSSHFLDDLVIRLQDFLQALIIEAQKEDVLISFTNNYKRINRRINALKNIIMPELELNIKQIKERLEEIDRENFVRLKKTKDLLERKRKLLRI